jgi:hypothetical protein
MPTLVYLEGFESQVISEATPPSGTGVWQSVNATTPATAFTHVAGRVDGSALHIIEDGVAETDIRADTPATQTFVFHGWFRMPSGAPVLDRSGIMGINSAAGGNMVRVQVRSAANGGTVEMQTGGGTRQTSIDVTDAAWHLLEFEFDSSVVGDGTTWTVDWQVDGTAEPQTSDAGNSATNSVRLFFGSPTATHNAVVEWDDVMVSNTSADYPLTDALSAGSDVYVAASNPSGNGDVTQLDVGFPSNAVVNQVPNGTNLYQSIDDWATGVADDTTYVTYSSTTTNGAASNYYGSAMDNLPADTADVWGVVGHAACFASATGGDNLTVRVVDSGGTNLGDIVAGDVSETTLRYFRSSMLTAPSGGWLTDFDGCQVRIGLSSDTNGNPRCSAVMLQAAVVIAQAQQVTLPLNAQAAATTLSLSVTAASISLPLITSGQATFSPTFFVGAELENDFDGGTDAATITTGNSGGASGNAFASVFISAVSTLVYDAANAAGSGLAAAVNPGISGLAYMEYRPTSGATWYGRVYLKLTALPPASIVLVDLRDNVAAANRGRVSITATGKLRITDAAGGAIATSATTVNVGSYCRIEFAFFGDATVGTFEARLYNSAESVTITETISGTGLNTGGTIDRIRTGQDTAPASDVQVFYVDRIAFNRNGYLGPWVAVPQTVTLPLNAQAAATTLAPSVTQSVTLPLNAQAAAAVLSANISNSGSAQIVTLPIIGYGWDQTPWDEAWDGGTQTFAPTAKLQVDGTLLGGGGTFSPNIAGTSILLPLITNAGAGTLVAAITQRVECTLIGDEAVTLPPSRLGADIEVTLPLIDSGNTTFSANVAGVEVGLPLAGNEAGALVAEVQLSIATALIGDEAVTLQATIVNPGVVLPLIDQSAATFAPEILQQIDLGFIDQLAVTLDMEGIVDANPQTVTLPVIDTSPATFAILDFAFGDPQQVDLELLGPSAETLFARIYQPLPTFIYKKALYRPVIHKKALYRPTIYKKARSEGMSITQSITSKDGFFTGEDQSIIWEVEAPSGTAPDTTGWSVEFRLSATETGTALVTKTASVAAELFEVLFAAADTNSLTPGNYFYTLSRTDPGSNHVCVDGGFKLRARVQ